MQIASFIQSVQNSQSTRWLLRLSYYYLSLKGMGFNTMLDDIVPWDLNSVHLIQYLRVLTKEIVAHPIEEWAVQEALFIIVSHANITKQVKTIEIMLRLR